MTRGRKKDLTIPPSRALAQQRDYRARKAQYLAQLEAHCRRVEQENVLLRQEIESLRAGLPVAASQSLNPQLVSICMRCSLATKPLLFLSYLRLQTL